MAKKKNADMDAMDAFSMEDVAVEMPADIEEPIVDIDLPEEVAPDESVESVEEAQEQEPVPELESIPGEVEDTAEEVPAEAMEDMPDLEQVLHELDEQESAEEAPYAAEEVPSLEEVSVEEPTEAPVEEAAAEAPAMSADDLVADVDEAPQEEAPKPKSSTVSAKEIQLQTLKEMLDQGVLTPEEFRQERARVLGITPPPVAVPEPMAAPVAEPVKDPVVTAGVRPATQPVEEKPQMSESVQTQTAAMPAPDYSRKLIRRERSGYAGKFRLGEGEEILSIYRALKGTGVGGRVYLTNRRFLMESALHTEMPVECVAGVSTGKSRHVKVVKLIFSLLFMLICAAIFFVFLWPVAAVTELEFLQEFDWLTYVCYGIGGIFGLIGLIMFCTSFVSRFVFTILTEGVQQTITVRSAVSRKDMDVYQPLVRGKKGRDYKKFCAEFGARLAEIRKALGK